MWCSGNIVDLYLGHQQSFGFGGFPQQHKADATTAPQLGHNYFLPHSFLLTDHTIIKHHTVCNADILVK